METMEARTLSPAELATFIKFVRAQRKWSQEQLAELSGLSVRTIQRLERGAPSDLDSRRAIARALDLDDIDALNKPFVFPTAEEFAEAQAKFEREHISLPALPLTSGKQLAQLAADSGMDLCTSGFEMARDADIAFASLTDCLRDFRDAADLYCEVDKFNVYDDLEQRIVALAGMGVGLRYAVRQVALKTEGADAKPFQTTVLYLVCFPAGKEPDHFAVPRKIAMKF